MPCEMTATPELSFEILVERARRGQRAELEELMGRCHRRIHALAFHMLGPLEADDAAQEALLRLATRLGELRDPGRFWAWALRVAGNLYRDQLRKRRPDALPLELADHLVGSDDPALEAQQGELRRQVARALDRLSPPLRITVVLRDLEGFSTREVADALDLPEGTVKSRLFEARRVLRSLLLGGSLE